MVCECQKPVDYTFQACCAKPLTNDNKPGNEVAWKQIFSIKFLKYLFFVSTFFVNLQNQIKLKIFLPRIAYRKKPLLCF